VIRVTRPGAWSAPVSSTYDCVSLGWPWLASVSSGFCISTAAWNAIQPLRSRVSPSGMRRARDPSVPATARKTSSAVLSGTLPTR
jgi:hypothetical protein